MKLTGLEEGVCSPLWGRAHTFLKMQREKPLEEMVCFEKAQRRNNEYYWAHKNKTPVD